LKKAIYKPSNQKVIVLSEANGYAEIFIDEEERNVLLLEESNQIVKFSILKVQL